MGGSGAGDGDGWRWAALAAAVWIQAAAGTNFDFPAYSTGLKGALGASQAELNGLAVASDLGKALGWSSGVAALHLPLPAVTGAAAAMGFAGYGTQWLLVAGYLRLHYATVFLMCLAAGCSICWFNTACFALCTRAFPCSRRRPLALSLSVSFNGASAALYELLASASPGPPTPSLYLLLNALVPLAVSLAALPPCLRYSSPASTDADADTDHDADVFLILHAFAFITGFYLLVLTSFSSGSATTARLLLAGAALLFLLPVFAPFALRACHWSGHSRKIEASGTDIELLREHLLVGDWDDGGMAWESTPRNSARWGRFLEVEGIIGTGQLVTLGEEHAAGRLLRRVDFWLYYVGYLCGATVGLVYSNNLGQIAQSLGRNGDGTTALVGVYSACSFFGRLLSSFPDLISSRARERRRLARTGWLAAALAPMPAAFFLLAGPGSNAGCILVVCTAVVGLSSGFVFAAAVSVTAELFGADSVGVNHNILVSNIPVGSLLYGLLAAKVYDSGARGGVVSASSAAGGGHALVCMGEQCYADTFRWWGLITTAGLACSAILFLRTRAAYDRPLGSSRRRWRAGEADALREKCAVDGSNQRSRTRFKCADLWIGLEFVKRRSAAEPNRFQGGAE